MDKKKDFQPTVELSVSDVDSVSETKLELPKPSSERRVVPSAKEVAGQLGLRSDGAQEDGAAELQIGDVVDGRYKVLRCLGVGAMGTVFLVEHTRLKKRFALKMVLPQMAQRKDFVARFEREANACSRLNHPNCISVTDFGRTKAGRWYLVMEYVDGVPLSDLLRQGPIPLEDAVSYVRQILIGLDHAHGKGIIHRDIKLENVFKCRLENGEVLIKILDFGMAKAPIREGENIAITRHGMVMGTPQYMPPEQLRNRPVDERGDLYSVGITLFRLITGKPVFEGESMLDIFATKLNQPAPTLKEVSDIAFPNDLDAFLQRVLDRDPANRFGSASEMLGELDRLFGGTSSEMTSELSVREPDMKAPAVPTDTSAGIVEAKEDVPVYGVQAPRTWDQLLRDFFDAPFEDLVYWYTCGRNPRRASWKNRMNALFRDRVGKMVLFRFVVVSLFVLTGAAAGLGYWYFGVANRNETPAVAPLREGNAEDNAADESTPTEAPDNDAIDDDDRNVAADTEIDTRDAANIDSASTEPKEDSPSLENEAAANGSTGQPGDGLSPEQVEAMNTAKLYISQNRCRGAELTLKPLLEEESAAGAEVHFLLGRSLVCQGKAKQAIQSYTHAIEIDGRYRSDETIGADTKDMLASPKAQSAAMTFVETTLKDAALPTLIQLAGHAQKRTLRHWAREQCEELSAIQKVNLEASYDWDLLQAGSCKQKREIVNLLAGLKTKRAKSVLIRARDAEERINLFRKRYVHECVRQDIINAIASF